MVKRKSRFLLVFFLFSIIVPSLFYFFPSALKKTSFHQVTDYPSPSPALPYETAIVLRVIDGDTLVVKTGSRKEKVRLIGIDCPERGEPFSKKARNLVRKLTLGRKIFLYRDTSDRDRHGRLLRYVFADQTFLNAKLVSQGYARAVAYPPNTKYYPFFLQLEKEAKKQKKGIYGKLIEP